MIVLLWCHFGFHFLTVATMWRRNGKHGFHRLFSRLCDTIQCKRLTFRLVNVTRSASANKEYRLYTLLLNYVRKVQYPLLKLIKIYLVLVDILLFKRPIIHFVHLATRYFPVYFFKRIPHLTIFTIYIRLFIQRCSSASIVLGYTYFTNNMQYFNSKIQTLLFYDSNNSYGCVILIRIIISKAFTLQIRHN